jgi:putative endonuclease
MVRLFVLYNMFTTYILYSKSIDSYYVGSTKDIYRRLQEHNRGKSSYTRCGLPWILVYKEDFLTKAEVYQRELQIKAWKSKSKILDLIQISNI